MHSDNNFSNTLNYDLPMNLEAEQAALGSMLQNSELVERFFETCEADALFDHSHRMIYEAMESLYIAREPIDITSVTMKLQRRNELEIVGGTSYLLRLGRSVATTLADTFDYYVKILNDHMLLRKMIRYGVQQIRVATEDRDVAKVLQLMQNSVDVLSDRSAPAREFVPVQEAAMEFFEELERRAMNRDQGYLTGVTSGFTDVDKMTAGFQKSDLIIVAARPSVGKTAFALNVATASAASTTEPVAVFSLEMSKQQLVQRMIAAQGNIDASQLRTGQMQEEDWYKTVKAISGLNNMFIDDTPGITVAEIRAKCRRLKKKHGLSMILIDYLQLISGSGRGENRQQEVSEISRTLKLIARELDVPVLALSQLSRGVEQRQDKRPMLSDLRESGSIEQDADIVAFLYRDDYYNAETEKKNIIELIFAKQRNGPIGTVELVFLKNYSKFANYERGYLGSA